MSQLLEQTLTISPQEDLEGWEILEINRRIGERFVEDDTLFVIGKDGEMEDRVLQAPCRGKVKQILVKIGDLVTSGLKVIVIETPNCP